MCVRVYLCVCVCIPRQYPGSLFVKCSCSWKTLLLAVCSLALPASGSSYCMPPTPTAILAWWSVCSFSVCVCEIVYLPVSVSVCFSPWVGFCVWVVQTSHTVYAQVIESVFVHRSVYVCVFVMALQRVWVCVWRCLFKVCTVNISEGIWGSRHVPYCEVKAGHLDEWSALNAWKECACEMKRQWRQKRNGEKWM